MKREHVPMIPCYRWAIVDWNGKIVAIYPFKRLAKAVMSERREYPEDFHIVKVYVEEVTP